MVMVHGPGEYSSSTTGATRQDACKYSIKETAGFPYLFCAVTREVPRPLGTSGGVRPPQHGSCSSTTTSYRHAIGGTR
jgi:hypothetical protein